LGELTSAVRFYLSVTLEILAELKHVLKQDSGLDLNISETSVLPKGVTPQAVFHVSHSIRNNPVLTPLNADVSLVSFCPEGFIGIGVPIDTDVFLRNFVVETCRAIIDDVEKLDAIQEDFIHYQLLRFCKATRLHSSM
jgi:hypothetical protein